VVQYNASTTLMTQSRISIDQVSNQPPAMDSSASKRIVYNDNSAALQSSTSSVYDSNYSLLGTLPGAPARAIAVNRQGTRAYVLSKDATNTLHTYDLTTAPAGAGSYPEIGTGAAQTVPASTALIPVRFEISPDGNTLFLTGDTGVSIIPAP
jgi:hypothetical protein